jgi:hypothetical protein
MDPIDFWKNIESTTLFGNFQRESWHMMLPPILWGVDPQRGRPASCMSTDRVLFSGFRSKQNFYRFKFCQDFADAEAQGIYVIRVIDCRHQGPPANSHRRPTATIELTLTSNKEGNS